MTASDQTPNSPHIHNTNKTHMPCPFFCVCRGCYSDYLKSLTSRSNKIIMDGGEYSSHPAAAAAGCFNDKQRRFSDKQIKSLETVFESDSKLEPRKKVQVARELGLQPRQVAIWFQNKRARWKSKQLEHDYTLLRQNYNTLASQYETLKMEKHNLAIQLNDMKHKLNHKTQSDGKQEPVVENSSVHDQPDGGNKQESTFAIKARPMLERLENGMNLLSDADGEEEDISMNAEYLELNPEPQLLVNMVVGEPEDSSITQSPENWDESGTSYQLWDFWS